MLFLLLAKEELKIVHYCMKRENHKNQDFLLPLPSLLQKLKIKSSNPVYSQTMHPLSSNHC